ncbi:MAG: trypsin-like serine protease, partial [Myxococcota bacterium]
MRIPAALALVLCLAWPAHSVIIDSGDGTGNTGAPAGPPGDPGWAHVGIRGGTNVVYVGNGWVLSANHVGVGDVFFDEVRYPPAEGAVKIRLSNPGGGPQPDLAVWQIDPSPPLPILPINAELNISGAEAILIGQGRDRGAEILVGNKRIGYEWGGPKTMRWGTNQVSGYATVFSTESIYTNFSDGSPQATTDEAQAANGDSGGAVFVDNGGGWELAGIMFAITTGSGCTQI